MADRFRTTFTIPVSFAQGEQPTGAKLNAISTQARNGLAVLERAIGDMWSQSGDPVTAAYPNRVTNLARVLGDQALLNSKLPLPDFTGIPSVRIRQPITLSVGKSEIVLDFKPENDSTLTASVQLLRNTSNNFFTGSSVATNDLVDTDTEWFVDTNKAIIHLGRALLDPQTTQYIEYNVLAANFPSDSVNSSGFSIIPSQTQLDWKGLKVSYISANKYFLTLPFRRPDATPSVLSKVPAVTNNEVVLGTSPSVRYFGPTPSGYSFTGAESGYTGIYNSRFYRYSLPEVALGMFTAPIAGTTIPTGTLYLWDTVTNTIIDGVTFRIPEAPMTLFAAQVPWVVQVEGSTLDQVFSGFTSSASSEASGDYQSRFALIGVGSSIAEAVSQLRKELVEGDAALGPRKRPSHRDLTETQPAQGIRHATNFPPSFVSGDGHPHLLSRLGSRASATVAEHRDRFNNGILGDLLLLSTNSTSNNQNLSGPSNYIYFGSHSGTSPRIRVNPAILTLAPAGISQHALELDNSSPVVGTGLIKMGNGYVRHVNNSDVGFFDPAGDSAGSLWVKSIRLNGTTQTLSTFTGSLNSARYIDISAWTANSFNFWGGNLTIGAPAPEIGDGPANVIIGRTSHLRLANNSLNFGTSDIDPPRMIYNGTDRFTLYRNSATLLADLWCNQLQSISMQTGSFACSTATATAMTATTLTATTIVTAGSTYVYSNAKTGTSRVSIIPAYFNTTDSYNLWRPGGNNLSAAVPAATITDLLAFRTDVNYDCELGFWLPSSISKASLYSLELNVKFNTLGGSGDINFIALPAYSLVSVIGGMGTTPNSTTYRSLQTIFSPNTTGIYTLIFNWTGGGNPNPIYDYLGNKIEGIVLRIGQDSGTRIGAMYIFGAKLTYQTTRPTIYD